MTQMDDHRWQGWIDPGTGAGYVRECRTDDAGDGPATPPFIDQEGRLRRAWTYHDLVAEHGERGATAILADLVDQWEASGGTAVLDQRATMARLADEIRGTGRALDDC